MNYLIINFYSPQNAGDLAILTQTVHQIHRLDTAAEVAICVSDTEILPDIKGAVWVRSWNWVVRGPGRIKALADLRTAYRKADVIISLGGGYFFVHDYRPVSTYATLSLLAAILTRKRVMCFPQSFGPFRFKYQAWFAARLLRGVSTLMIREEPSLTLLSQTDPQLAARATLVPDTAFTLVLEQPERAADTIKTSSLYMGITLLDWESVNPFLHAQKQYEDSVAQVIIYAWQKYQAHVTLFVQCRSRRRDFESDEAVTRRVAELALKRDPTIAAHLSVQAELMTPAEYLQAYASTDIFIGTRMHSLIFAACGGVPIMAIGYQHKSLGLMKMLQVERFYTEMSQLTSAQLIERFELALAERETLSHQLTARTQALGLTVQQAIQQALQR
ncbi:MAG TPA: polysaccharide pyruvyl transferase family protein [Anaerolineae bacterium]|jgi:colanic acid/amylovoran biosynthesis protein